MALRLIFDTSVLRDNGVQMLNSPEVQSIKELASNQHIYVHIPYIVNQEFKSNRFNDYRKRISDIEQKISSLCKSVGVSDTSSHNKLVEMRDYLKSNAQNIASDQISYIDKWMQESCALIEKLNINGYDEVFDKYFSGRLPFKSEKNRNDIPDAIIFQTILEIKEKHKDDDVAVIAADIAIVNACAEYGLKNYRNLNEFRQSIQYDNLIKNKKIASNISIISDLILDKLKQDNNKIVYGAINEYMEQNDGDFEISKKLGIELDNVSILRDSFIFSENIDYLGGSKFTCFFNVKARVSYFRPIQVAGGDDNLFSKEMDFLNFSGRIIFSLDKDIESEEVNALEGSYSIGISDFSADDFDRLEKELEKNTDNSNICNEQDVNYYILNTNIKNSESDHKRILDEGIAAAFFNPWKFSINRLRQGDIVFLYHSGIGIVAFGSASGDLKVRDYEEYDDEEHYMKLIDFCHVKPAIPASEIKVIADRNFNFMKTMFRVDSQSGVLIQNVCKKRCGKS